MVKALNINNTNAPIGLNIFQQRLNAGVPTINAQTAIPNRMSSPIPVANKMVAPSIRPIQTPTPVATPQVNIKPTPFSDKLVGTKPLSVMQQQKPMTVTESKINDIYKTKFPTALENVKKNANPIEQAVQAQDFIKIASNTAKSQAISEYLANNSDESANPEIIKMQEDIKKSGSETSKQIKQNEENTKASAQAADFVAGITPIVGQAYGVVKGGVALGEGIYDLTTNGKTDRGMQRLRQYQFVDEKDYDKMSDSDKQRVNTGAIIGGILDTGFSIIGAKALSDGVKASGSLVKGANSMWTLFKQAPKEFFKKSIKNVVTNTAIGTGIGSVVGGISDLSAGDTVDTVIQNAWDRLPNTALQAFKSALTNEFANRFEDSYGDLAAMKQTPLDTSPQVKDVKDAMVDQMMKDNPALDRAAVESAVDKIADASVDEMTKAAITDITNQSKTAKVEPTAETKVETPAPQVTKTKDPMVESEARINKGLEELSNIRKQYSSDEEFFDKVILENQDAPGEIGDFARHIARRDATEGSIYNKNYLTEILDDELAPLNSKLDQAINQSSIRDGLAKSIRDLEKSTGQKGLWRKVASEMQGMNEKQQIEYMGKAMLEVRDSGILAADYINKQNGDNPASQAKNEVPTSSKAISVDNVNAELSAPQVTKTEPNISKDHKSVLESVRNSKPTDNFSEKDLADISFNKDVYEESRVVAEKAVNDIFKANSFKEVQKIHDEVQAKLGETVGDIGYLRKGVADAEVYRRHELVDSGVEPSGVNPTGNSTPQVTKTAKLYRETNTSEALGILPHSLTFNDTPFTESRFFSSNKDLAIGQGNNKGVMLEFDDTFNAKESMSKPNSQFLKDNGGGVEKTSIVRNSELQKHLTSITVKSDAVMSKVEKIKLNSTINKLVEQDGWVKTANDDGSITYTKPSTPIVTKTPTEVPTPTPKKVEAEVIKPIKTPKVTKPVETLAPIKKPVVKATPVVDESGKPLPIKQPKAITEEANRSKQKSIADKKRGISEIRRIAGEDAAKEVYTITNPNAKAAGVYRPQDSRIGIKGVGELETYRHEAMHKAFAENLTPEQQANVFKAILRNEGVSDVDFKSMKQSEISALIGNADEKLNYSLSEYIKDTGNIKDPELKQYFNDIFAGKYNTRQKQNAKVWSETGTNGIAEYLSGENGAGYKDIAPKVKTPSEKTSKQVAGQISRNKKTNADYTPNRAVAETTTGEKLMNEFVDKTTALNNGVRRMDENLNIKDGASSKIPKLMKDKNAVVGEVEYEIKHSPDTSIAKFFKQMTGKNTDETQLKFTEFDEYQKIKSTIQDKNNGLVYNENYDNPARLSELESKYSKEFSAIQDVYKDIRQNIKPYLTAEALDAMESNPDYIPMRRDFKDTQMAKAFFGKEVKSSTQGIVKSKQGGSTKDILSPTDTMLKMYIASKRAKVENEIISSLADNRYGFKKLGKYSDVPDGYTKMSYFENGKQKSIAVPEKWADALAPRISKTQSDNIFHKIGKAATYPIKLGATGANIAFQAANVPKDLLQTVITTDQSGKFVKNIPKGFWSAVTNNGEVAEIGLRRGVLNNTKFTGEIKDTSVNALSEALSNSGVEGKIINATKHPIDTVKRLMQISDNVTRSTELAAQLDAATKNGLSGKAREDWAVAQANKHLPDYAASGKVTAAIGEYKPYLSASVAGTRPLFRAFKERPGSTIAKTGALVAAAAISALVQGNDEAVGEAYDSLTEDEKNHNFIIMLSDRVDENGKADFIKIPLSPSLYAFKTAGNTISDIIRGKFNSDNVKNLISETVSSGTPINLSLEDSQSAGWSVINSVLPSIISTAVQSTFGVNYKGNKQYDEYADDWAKTLSGWTNGYVTPSQLNEAGKGLLGNIISPEKMVDVPGRFYGGYTKSGTPQNATSVTGADIKVYQPKGGGLKRIKGGKDATYEVTYGNDLAKDNYKIKRLDEETPKYTDSVEGLSDKDVSYLAKTDKEITTALKSNSYDDYSNYLVALKNAEDRDISTKDEKHDYYGRSMTTSQALAVSKLNKNGNYDYDFQNLYNEISVEEWRDLGDPDSDSYDEELYKKLYQYDSERANVNASDSSSNTSKNKYSVKKTGGTAESNAKKSAKAMLNAINAKPTQTLSNKPIVKQAAYKKVPIVESTKLSAQNKYAPIRVSAKSAKTKDKSIAI